MIITQYMYKTPDRVTVELNLNDSIYHNALVEAYEGIDTFTNINENVLQLKGMSGIHYRKFINSLIKNIDTPRYLEVGSYTGSTACAAISNNKCHATCIDNWSQFGGPKEEFHRNIKSNLTKHIKFNFFENDFRKVDYSSIGKYNVYFFDGPHSEQDQYDGLAYAQDALDNVFIFIVDDYNVSHVRQGTQRAIESLNLKVLESIEILAVSSQNTYWWNGYYISVLQKPSTT